MGPLTLIVFAPILSALLILFIPKHEKLFIRYTALGGSFASLLLSLFLLLKFERGGGMQLVEKIPWVPQLGIEYHLALDGMGVMLCLLNAIILFCGVFSSWSLEDRPKEFFALLLILAGGVFGVFLSFDLFVFFLFYEIAVLPMYLLIGVWGTGRKEYSAMKLTLMLLFGSAFVLVALLALYWARYEATGVLSFDLSSMMDSIHMGSNMFSGKVLILGHAVGFQDLFYPFIFIGFGILAGLFPFHTWSPDGHASAPTAVSMLHAGVLMKLGAFGIIRVGLALLPQGAETWAIPFACLTLINIVYGSLAAMKQTDMKYIIAYSSVSHMGIVNLGICAMTIESLQGSVMQMVSHGFMTGLFFALIGVVYSRIHTRDITSMGGLVSKMPFAALAFTLGGFASLGLPGLSGFVAEIMVFIGTIQADEPIFRLFALIACTSVVFTAIYVLRAVQKIFYGPFDEKKNKYFAGLTDANLLERISLGILMFMIVLIGVYPAWSIRLVFDGLQPVFKGLGI